MLRLAIPKGSLEEGTFNLFKQADLPIIRKGDRDYNFRINDPRIEETFMLRPQEIASYVADGEFDIGITGKDWTVETEACVKEIADLEFSRGGWNKVKMVLAADDKNNVDLVENIAPDARIATEYPRITRRYFKEMGKRKVKIRMSYGATEVKVPRLAEYLVDITETGNTLLSNGKKILATIMESTTLLIANPESLSNEKKAQAINEIKDLLMGVIMARDKVLIKMNIVESNLDSLLSYIPSLRKPTIGSLYQNGSKGEKWFMVETVVRKSTLNIILPELRKIGAREILEIDVSKVIL